METDKLVDFDHVTDYISREAAIRSIADYDDWFIDEETGEWVIKMEKAEELLEAIPATDVRPVVRCKDCRFFYNGFDEKCCINHKGVVKTDENGFCHHAERMADNG